MPTACQQSKIFYLIRDKLEEQDDPIGMFAYAVYKRQKMAERNRLEEYLGRPPTNEDLLPFVLGAEARIDDFLKIAEIELSEFQNAKLEVYMDDLAERYEKSFQEEIQRFRPQKQPSWFKSALYGMAGNILTVALTFLLFIIGMLVLNGTPSLVKLMLPILAAWANG